MTLMDFSGLSICPSDLSSPLVQTLMKIQYYKFEEL